MVTGIGHTAIRARDIEESARFYTEVVGITEAFRMYNAEGVCDTIYLYIGPNQFIEIFPGGTEAFTPGPKTIGPVHLCFQVDNAERSFEELRARGAVIDREITVGRSGCKQFWSKDPDGNRLEFMELLPASMQYKANERLSVKGHV